MPSAFTSKSPLILTFHVCLKSKLSGFFNLHVLYIGFCLVFIIYLIRAITLVLFSGFDINPQLFLAPRGLITILLFFSIPENLVADYPALTEFHANTIPGIFLFII